MHRRALPALIVSFLWADAAHAATCSFAPASGVLTVSMAGTTATLKAGTDRIRLDGVACGSATTTNVTRIEVDGAASGLDVLTLAGTFAPGRNDVPETDDPEIEIAILGFDDASDRVQITGDAAEQVWLLTAAGVNLNGDLDQDIALPDAGRVELRALGGNDTIDARRYTGGAILELRGGGGNDVLTGSPQGDDLHGDDGNDTLSGGAGGDWIDDGRGADRVRGGPGNDYFVQRATADAGDDFRGNDGIDDLSYGLRANGVVASIDGVADDGEPGEGDNIHVDIENLSGGDGDDVLVGSNADNVLDGLAGSDQLFGGPGDDWLRSFGDATTHCHLAGEGGNDQLDGGDGDDFLEGGAGNDDLFGFAGNDTLDGGSGVDDYFGDEGDDVFFNQDAAAETVVCGPGTDDPEPDPLDTFIACENI